MINTNSTARISKDEELKREIDDVIKTVALELKTKFVEFQTKVSDTAKTIEVLTAKVDNKNKETSIRISDIDLKINTQNTKTTTDFGELKKEIENIVEYNTDLDKRIINSNTQSQTKLTKVRKDLGTYVSMLEDKITQAKKDLTDDNDNIKELLFNKNGTFKLVKLAKFVELDEQIKNTKEQSWNEITAVVKRVEVIEKTKRPLQFSLNMASFTAEQLYGKNVVNAINIFDTNNITFTITDSSNNF